MYFQVTLKRNMLLHPRNFGPKMREVLRANLKKEVEGTCNGKYGYIVLVTKIHEGEGFQVRYPTVGERERARGAALRQLVASQRLVGTRTVAHPLPEHPPAGKLSEVCCEVHGTASLTGAHTPTRLQDAPSGYNSQRKIL